MRTRLHKLRGHAEEVITQFRQVRASYAVLVAMASDAPPIARIEAGTAQAAPDAVKRALLHTCIQDLAALCLDDFEQTPSIVRLVAALDDRPLVERLRDAARGEDIDGALGTLREAWPPLLNSPELRTLRIARDRVVAHHEVRRVAGRYRAVTLSEIGVETARIGRVVGALAPVVDALSRIIRGVGLDDEACRAEAKRPTAAFRENGP